MTETKQISDKWIKASILGTIWASSEIVLGSFLHNLRVPFSGNILTAIGLIILISASYKWKEKGLFWRAGIITALMKTLSPSAVIFGPMIAIVTEAFLLELSVRLLGRTIPGFMLGSVLAMSWNLVQKIVNYIIFYGYNIVEVYTNLMDYAQRQMNLRFDAVWAPLFLLLGIYAGFGIFISAIAVKTGRSIVQLPVPDTTVNIQNPGTKTIGKHKSGFTCSIPWLAVNVILMAGALLTANRLPFAVWSVAVATIALVWALRYKRALRQLARPKLWIFFVIITMVTALVLARLKSDSLSIAEALEIGLEMNLRAIILIMGFSVLGTELYHPKIRDFLGRSHFRQLPPALELSLSSLPYMVTNVPEARVVFRNPVKVIHQLMSHAEIRFDEIKRQMNNYAPVFIITGGIGKGKTTCLQMISEKLQHAKMAAGGILSLRITENQTTTGYDAFEIATGNRWELLVLKTSCAGEKIGKFCINGEGFIRANESILRFANESTGMVIIDETGLLELEGRGWSETISKLVRNARNPLLLSVRFEVLDRIIALWNLHPVRVFNVEKEDGSVIAENIGLKLREYMVLHNL